MLGSDAILRALEHEGVDVAFGIPGGAILPTYDAIARGTTVRHVLARHEQGAGHMAEGYARASGKVGVAIATSGPGATNLVTPIADAWMDSTPLVCITGQVRAIADRHRRVPGDRRDRHHDADRQALVARPGRRGAAGRDQGRLPRRAHRPAGPGARRHRQGRAGGRVRLRVPGRGRPAGLEAAAQGAPSARCARPPRAIAEAKRPIVYAGGGVLNADACAELLELVESAHLPAVVTLMGKGCLPDSHPLNYGAPGHARLEVRELGAEQGRPRDRGRLALRRPRHRQGLRLRARREGDPLRHRRGRGREDPPRGDPGRRAAEAGARAAHRRGARPCRGRPRPTASRGCGSSRSGASSSRSATAEDGRRAEAADRARGAARPRGGPRRGRRLDDRRRPASDVGDAVPRLRPAALVHHLRRARHDGLRPARRDRRQGGTAGRHGRLRRRRRLLPDDVPGARDRGARTAADRRGDRQQRLARNGAPVAGDVLRRAVRADAPDARGARLRAARRGVRLRGLHRRERGRARGRARGGVRRRPHRRRRRPLRPAEEKCFPMVPAGAAARRRDGGARRRGGAA